MAVATQDIAFTGSVPELYDRLLVPLIFQAYADAVADRIATLGPARVLETAAGTGVVTRAMVNRLGERAEITATDLNMAMLEQAKRQLGENKQVQWGQADALKLPYEDGQFDAVVCQFGAMFFPDRVAGYREARRVLKPGGTFLFSVWDRIADNEFADVVTKEMGKIFPADPPVFLARTPHGYYDIDQIRKDVAAAGYRDIQIEPLEAMSRAKSARDVAVAYCEGTPLRGEIEARGNSVLSQATDRATDALIARYGKGPIAARMKAIVITARN
jgi:ubiquinone/menaquinone biosynthesis C-methylase UbiE